jgi:hypothetical protein
MRVEVEEWTIVDLLAKKSDIQDQPPYQRGKVWPLIKQQLLIDSVLRGIDLPKLYLRVNKNGFFKYEVADGQQRLNALSIFCKGDLVLSSDENSGVNLDVVEKVNVGGLNYDGLKKHKKLFDKFNEYKITVALIHDADDNQIRTLFGRLQLGSQLNPAEKRNAIISEAGEIINKHAFHHDFFKSSQIPEPRFKRQDYLANAFTLIHYNNKSDLKADLISRLYSDCKHTFPAHYDSSAFQVLNWMAEINQNSSKKLINKWAFVDVFWLLYKNLREKKLKGIDAKGFGEAFTKFEIDRKAHHKSPKSLIDVRPVSAYNQRLYNYVLAFKLEGAKSENIKTRNDVLETQFHPFLKF